MTRIPVSPAFPRSAPRPALRDRLRSWARRLSGPLMALGLLVMFGAVGGLETTPVLREVPVIVVGVALFAAGMRASGLKVKEWMA